MNTLIFLSALIMGGQDWTNQQVETVFDLLYIEGVSSAVTHVESFGVTPYDFGIDLVERNEHERATTWYSAMAKATDNDPKYLFGKAWTLRSTGQIPLAIQTANILTERSDPLVRARAHYLLGILFRELGSSDYANRELVKSRQLYEELGKIGGVLLCSNLLGVSKTSETSTPSPNVIPPRDGDDS